MSVDKRNQIMESAIKLFAEKGFFNTSVQEIADESGIAKGSIYKYFPSKEDLLISVFEYYQNMMIEKANEIKKNSSLTPIDYLQEHVILLFDEFQIKNREFLKLHFKEQQNQDSNKIKQFMTRIRRKMMNWNKESLLYVFGDEILPYIWDLVIIFQGMIKEYLMLSIIEKKELDLRKTSEFIVKRIEAVVKELLLNKPKPVLGPEIINEAGYDSKKNIKPVPEILGNMLRIVQDIPLTKEEKKELAQLINKLEAELSKEVRDPIMFKVLLNYLEQYPDLKEAVTDIRNAL